jgi:hypothetical protein
MGQYDKIFKCHTYFDVSNSRVQSTENNRDMNMKQTDNEFLNIRSE